MPGPRRRPDPRQAETGDGAILADDGGHVGDRADDGEVRQIEGGLRTVRFSIEEQLCDLEGDPRAGQARVRVDAVWAMRIDDGHGRRQLLGHVVVVGDDDVDAGLSREGHLGHARRARIDGDDQAALLRPRPLDGHAARGHGPHRPGPARGRPRRGPADGG